MDGQKDGRTHIHTCAESTEQATELRFYQGYRIPLCAGVVRIMCMSVPGTMVYAATVTHSSTNELNVVDFDNSSRREGGGSKCIDQRAGVDANASVVYRNESIVQKRSYRDQKVVRFTKG